MRGTPALANHHLLDLYDTRTRLAAQQAPEGLIERWPRVLIDEVVRGFWARAVCSLHGTDDGRPMLANVTR